MSAPGQTAYHGARWQEPIVYELGGRGRRGFKVPTAEPELRGAVGDVISTIPTNMRREKPPPLPELSEPEVVRHFVRLSQQTFGVDSGINAGVGTCTMKYSPKVNEALVRSPKLADLHPLQDEESVQGVLELMYRVERMLCEISGMDAFSLQPRGGAHAVFTNARIIDACLRERGERQGKDEVVTTVLSHPCNGASPAAAGFKVKTVYPDMKTGIPDIEAFKRVVSKRTAGLMITDPYDTGVFDPNLEEYIKIVHEVGGLVSIDQANLNSVLGRLRIGDFGADLCQFNLHKSFSTPHASGGPGCSPIGVKKALADYLPSPTIEKVGRRYRLKYDMPSSIGKVAEFYGVVPNVVRAYCWIRSMGPEGLLETSAAATLNDNYLIKRLSGITGVTLPWSRTFPTRLQEARFSLETLRKDTGVGIEALNRRIVDYGVQRLFPGHEPWIVPEPFTPEPTESSSKEDLDRFVEIMNAVCNEAYQQRDIFRDAPYNCSIHRVDMKAASDPKKWALTWRAYRRKRASQSAIGGKNLSKAWSRRQKPVRRQR
ncbi:MAG TPA: aminomethyl-transferring glycine dehydrogenase subunit GcvPB [Nitrososphaerales archaeon]|nr:aminomethyl-transferring glycine dehydrogenase subunit GcvPB [Nitrososphaerales archaeon]